MSRVIICLAKVLMALSIPLLVCWGLWVLWGWSVPFEYAFSFTNELEKVRTENGKGYWKTVYADPDSNYNLQRFIDLYKEDTAGRNLLEDRDIDLDKYTYIVCAGITLHRLARSPYVDKSSPYADGGLHIGKAYVKLDDPHKVNVYRTGKIYIDGGEPHSNADSWTVLLPQWFPSGRAQ